MKNIKFLFAAVVLFFVSTFVSAQVKDWKEKNEFHKVMSTTFHPAEEGNLAPIKSKIGEMQEKAIAFQKSVIPADVVNKKEVQKNLKDLVKGTKALNKKINANASDEVIKNDLTSLHDVFHKIVGLCSAEDKHDH
jgi:ABC-type Zn uptake system ZnuABC Zn-binding protein ZnuA